MGFWKACGALTSLCWADPSYGDQCQGSLMYSLPLTPNLSQAGELRREWGWAHASLVNQTVTAKSPWNAPAPHQADPSCGGQRLAGLVYSLPPPRHFSQEGLEKKQGWANLSWWGGLVPGWDGAFPSTLPPFSKVGRRWEWAGLQGKEKPLAGASSHLCWADHN